ncbi:MAG TPA: endonuclease MutS2 [Bacteroidota bacterium]|nr:endonuclease MutS2 [Bacteroidota bacterium]
MYQEISSEIERVCEKLEFNKLLQHISRYAVSTGGKQQLLQLRAKYAVSEIQDELKKVTDGKSLLLQESAVPLNEFRDITLSLKKAEVENQALTIVELLDILTILKISRELRHFLGKRQQEYPILAQYCQSLVIEKILEYNLENALDPQGIVKDSASKDLHNIRHALNAAYDKLRKHLETIMRKVSEHEFLQEEIITTRDGRLVIPVKVEHKNRVPGFIHSTSASGATVYVEPAETLELNNEIRELQLKEQREIHRILLELTKQVTSIKDELHQTYQTLVEIDSVLARAKYSIEVQGNEPTFSDEPYLHLYDARHPILLQHINRRNVVPLSLELGKHDRTLVITGPNAGGKTVALKFVGLLSLCAQSGLHIPASPDSVLYPFTKIFVDIGDEQSIDNDLSSFSSHLIYLKQILLNADNKSLVLIDEIGTGTDPAEGAAIAIGVLSELTKRGALTIATTHHGTLKAFASTTEGVVNGSMEFDQQSLLPTYRYRHGIPGSSYAFELAERIGFPQDILAFSRKQLGNERVQLEKFLIEIESKTQLYAQRLKETEEEKKHLEELTHTYEQKIVQIKHELATIKKRAVEDAKKIVQDAYAQIEKTIKEIREQNADKNIIKASKQTLHSISAKLAELSVDTSIPQETENLKKGDIVRIKNGSGTGEIISISNGIATVVSSYAKLNIPLGELIKENSGKLSYTSAPLQSQQSADIVATVTNQIDLRGKTGEEAIREIESFLDAAYSAGLHEVSIIHGKGSGKLRKKISDYLTTYPHIKSFRLGEWNEGGSGITIVEFN